MNIELTVIGKTTQDFTRSGLQVYANRIKHYANFSVHEIKTPKVSVKTGTDIIKAKEAELLLKHFDKSNAYVVLLDERGKRMTSRKFAGFLQKIQTSSNQRLIFVVGGAYGFAPEVKKRADLLLSLSDMTFSHQIIRLFFAEQLYRAFTIINNKPYHNE